MLHRIVCGHTCAKSIGILVLQRVVKGNWNVPSETKISAGAPDLLGRILKPDATKRITVEGIINHPWYQIHLPPGADKPNYPKRPEEGLQVRDAVEGYFNSDFNRKENESSNGYTTPEAAF